ncbi:hypothetical protein PHMEG_0004277 [Phytophthora megakarya]|uniref:START domain-containing protein n=1 Tax=Phytophthora megakarya TaxID=4795 RepID=A0A225WU82_9STRA|nr:hypothetical protein PHMEG_0004277 [Phytophthora megakarya]
MSDVYRDLNLPGGKWNNPSVLLAVGTIDNTLDEVMFGLETPDFQTMQVRAETLVKHPINGDILTQLAGPTEIDPFQFMGVTWFVGQPTWPFKLVAHARDFVVVSATGVMRHTTGELIGYEMVQSIHLPECPPLPKSVVRGKIMYGAIYRQREEGDVDVFIHIYVETHCRLFDKLVVAEIWDSVVGFWNAPSLSEAKKLQWCMDNKSVLLQHKILSDNIEKFKHYENCPSKRSSSSRRRSTHLSDHGTCALCMVQICSSCRVKRTLKVPDEHSKLLDLHVAVCRKCILVVQDQDPAEIAIDNQRKREAQQHTKREDTRRRMTFPSMWGFSLLSTLGTNKRYPSISVSDLVKLINSFSDVGTNQIHSVRRKTDPLH